MNMFLNYVLLNHYIGDNAKLLTNVKIVRQVLVIVKIQQCQTLYFSTLLRSFVSYKPLKSSACLPYRFVLNVAANFVFHRVLW